MLTGLGVTLGVAAFLAAVGISSSGATAVARTFDASRATEVSFAFERSDQDADAVIRAVCARLGMIDGTVAGGVFVENALGPSAVPIARGFDTDDPTTAPVHAATNGYLAASRAVVTGDVTPFDAAAAPSRRALIGRALLRRSGLGALGRGDRIVVGGTSYEVAGVVERAPRDPRLATSIVIPVGSRTRPIDAGPTKVIGLIRTELGRSQSVASTLTHVAVPELDGSLHASPAVDLSAIEHRVVTQVDGVAVALGLTSLVVGGVGILNSMSVSVIERRSELGLRRCLGATRPSIAMLIAMEGAFVGVVGAAMGSALGVAVVAGVSALRAWPVVLPPGLVVATFAAGVGVGLVGGVVPAWRGTRVTPIDALRR